MGLKEKLVGELGRPPTKEELAAAQAKRDAKRAKKAQTSVITIRRVLCKERGNPHALEIVSGPMSKVPILLSHANGKMLTTLCQVREKASSAFAGSTESFWQLFVGESVDDYIFLSTQETWAEQCQIMLLENGIERNTIYARQVCTTFLMGGR